MPIDDVAFDSEYPPELALDSHRLYQRDEADLEFSSVDRCSFVVAAAGRGEMPPPPLAPYSIDAFFRNAAEKKAAGAQQQQPSVPATATVAAADSLLTNLFGRLGRQGGLCAAAARAVPL